MQYWYSIVLTPNGDDGYLVTAPDVPELATAGTTREEALVNAADALEVALLGRMKDGDELPEPVSRAF